MVTSSDGTGLGWWEDFADLQFVLYDEVLGEGHAIPCEWDRTFEGFRTASMAYWLTASRCTGPPRLPACQPSRASCAPGAPFRRRCIPCGGPA
jgi:hypothetical protein